MTDRYKTTKTPKPAAEQELTWLQIIALAWVTLCMVLFVFDFLTAPLQLFL